MRKAAVFVSVLIVSAIAGLARAADYTVGGITVVTPWARATPGGAKVGGAFLEIRAAAGADDKLISASSPVSGIVELHDHIHDNGVMRMRRVDGIAIPGGKTTALKPGGLHIMLMDLKQGLKQGETVELTLVFEKAGTIKVPVPIAGLGALQAPGAAPAAPAASGGHGSGHKH